jgi:hypothetical protein
MEEKRSLPGNLELFGGFYAMYLPRTRFVVSNPSARKFAVLHSVWSV